MSKRLFIAVLAIGLVLTLSGPAMSTGENPGGDRIAQPLPYPTNVDYSKARLDRMEPAQKLLLNERMVDSWTPRSNEITGTDTTACYVYFDWIDWANFGGSVSYFDMYGGTGQACAAKYDISKYHTAEVYSMSFRLSESSANSGGCDVEVAVWTDNGGLPGTIIFADTIPAASLPHPVAWAGYWIEHTFSTPVLIEGERYFHISWGPTDDSPADDYVECLFTRSGDAQPDYQVAANRSSFRYAGDWYLNADLWGGGDADNWQDVTYCEWYSQCYYVDQLPDPGYVWWWGMPDPAWTDPACVWNGVAQQFRSPGPDTLWQVRVFHRDWGDVDYPEFGSDLIVEVWGDDGLGNPDYASGYLAQVIVPGVRADLFPQTGGDGSAAGWNWVYVPMPAGLVVYGDWHVSSRLSSDDPAGGVLWFPLSYEGNPAAPEYTDGTGASVNFSTCGYPWQNMSTHPVWTAEVGIDMSYFIRAYLCKDEFYDCQIQYTWDTYTSIADYGDPVAQLIRGNPVNQINEIMVMPYDIIGTPDLIINIYEATPTGPGAVVYADTLPYGTYHTYTDLGPVWWTTVVIPHVWTFGDFFIGYASTHATDPASNYVNWLMENIAVSGGVEINGGLWYDYGGWYEWDGFNLVMYCDFCSIIVEERPCSGTGDWSTLQGDFQRTGASGLAIGDAQCRLTLNWAADNDGFGQYLSPIVYENKVIAPFYGGASGAEYKVFYLDTKADVFPPLYYTGSPRCVPTAQYVAAIDKDVLFVTGGTAADVVQAIDLATGGVLWTINAATFGQGMTATEVNTYGNFIILNDGVDDVLYFTTDLGKVFAAYAATGLPYAGWATFYQYTGGFGPLMNRSGCTDGDSLLFYNVQTVTGGDVVCLQAFTKTEKWLLSADGFKGNDAYGGGVQLEGFLAGTAFDKGDELTDPGDDFLFTMSTVVGPYPLEAVIYKIDPYAGTTAAYSICNNVAYYITLVIDKNRVYVQSHAYYYGPPNDGQMQAFRKTDLVLDWAIFWGDGASWENDFDSEILLTCEPAGLTDLIFAFSTGGFLHCIAGDDGTELFNRRITDIDFGGNGGVIAMDALDETHLFFETARGGMIDLTMQDLRPRLFINTYTSRAAVPFGTDPNLAITFPEIFTNTGCVDLTTTINISETSNGTPAAKWEPVSASLTTSSNDIAAFLATGNSFKVGIPSGTRPEAGPITESIADKAPINRAALADMSWINTPTLNYTVAPGAMQDLVVSVNQGMVGRGVFPFYAEFTTTNDPDYWLDTWNTPPGPEVQLTFLGGCLVDTALLTFGDGELNHQVIFNTGRLTTDERSSDGEYYGFLIDGVEATMFQGNYVMGVSDHRIALNQQTWSDGAPPEDSWKSWVPDLYDGECKPYLEEDVTLGQWSDDGVTYHNIYGNRVLKNAIDSVQNFDDGAGGWDWTEYFSPYDNDSTMGLAMHSTHFGAYDYGQASSTILQTLNNATVEIIEFHERNGNTVPSWKLGAYLDYDVRPGDADIDTTVMDRGISTGWFFCKSTNTHYVAGMLKLPFSPFCAEGDPSYLEPMKNCYAIDQRQGMWGATATDVPYLDSVYHYMSLAPGAYGHNPLPADEDMAAHFTFTEHDFTPHETYTVGIGIFEFGNYAAPGSSAGLMTELAHTLNKWLGYGRGDVNNDNVIDLADIVYLANYVNYGGPGAIPFAYLANVNTNTTAPYYTQDDVTFLVDYYFNGGPCPSGILKHTAKSIVEE